MTRPEERFGRRAFIRRCGRGAAALALPLILEPSCRSPSRRPNFLFFLADDLGWSDITSFGAAFGNTFHETPNIDRLAATGMRFTSAYAASAVCSPTRASIQTGKYPVRLGITDWIPGERHRKKPLATRFTKTELPLEEETIAEALKEHGYRTAFLGKWHLGGEAFHPQHQGYDINVAGNRKGHPHDGYFSPYNLAHLENGPDGEYLTDRLTDEALKILDGFARRQPFLLFMSYYTVHMPIEPRPDLKKRYDEKRKRNPNPLWKNTGYAGMVHGLDESVGRILDRLEKLGIDKETIVIFMSDNGGVDYASVTSNHPLREGKGRYHEGGIREPMIIRWPGTVRTGSECGVPVISNDFYPTMLEMAGLPRNRRLDGLSLVPLLKGGKELDRDALFWHYPHYHGSGAAPCSAVRLGDYKLIRYYEDGRVKLYDLANDRSEEKDLAPAMPGKVRELENRLDAWIEETGAYIPEPRKG